MSKAVLVMDMPSSCLECPIGQNESIPLETCIRCPLGKCVVDAETETIPDWCPLKPMPDKRSTEYNPARNPYITEGYNACIDELLAYKE
jgi:hypothetical protein